MRGSRGSVPGDCQRHEGRKKDFFLSSFVLIIMLVFFMGCASSSTCSRCSEVDDGCRTSRVFTQKIKKNVYGITDAICRNNDAAASSAPHPPWLRMQTSKHQSETPQPPPFIWRENPLSAAVRHAETREAARLGGVLCQAWSSTQLRGCVCADPPCHLRGCLHAPWNGAFRWSGYPCEPRFLLLCPGKVETCVRARNPPVLLESAASLIFCQAHLPGKH